MLVGVIFCNPVEARELFNKVYSNLAENVEQTQTQLAEAKQNFQDEMKKNPETE